MMSVAATDKQAQGVFERYGHSVCVAFTRVRICHIRNGGNRNRYAPRTKRGGIEIHIVHL